MYMSSSIQYVHTANKQIGRVECANTFSVPDGLNYDVFKFTSDNVLNASL